MTCKDCVHYEVCKDEIEFHRAELSDLEVDGIEAHCEHFKLQSRFVELPCEVGQTVYKVVKDKRIKKPFECKVVGVWYSMDERCNNLHLVRYVNGVFDSSFSVPFMDVGKTVFLTKEEAENALKEREKE